MELFNSEHIEKVISVSPITEQEIQTIRQAAIAQSDFAEETAAKIGLQLPEDFSSRKEAVSNETAILVTAYVIQARLDNIYAEGVLDGDLEAVVNPYAPTQLMFFLTDKGLRVAKTLAEYTQQKIAVWKVLNAA